MPAAHHCCWFFSVAGTLIRRQRIPLPPPDDDQFYNIFHFNINQQMVLYSRTFTVTSCDSFTRNFLTKLGVVLNDPATVPDDPYSNLREEVGIRVRAFLLSCFGIFSSLAIHIIITILESNTPSSIISNSNTKAKKIYHQDKKQSEMGTVVSKSILL